MQIRLVYHNRRSTIDWVPSRSSNFHVYSWSLSYGQSDNEIFYLWLILKIIHATISDMRCIHKSLSNVIQISDCSSWCISYSLLCIYNAWCHAFWRSHFQLAKSYSWILYFISIYSRWFQAGIQGPRCPIQLRVFWPVSILK